MESGEKVSEKTEYVFYFDESQKTDVFQIRDGKPTFDTLDDLHSFVGVFCGYPIDKVEQFRESVESFEMIWKTKYNLKPDQEFKSTNIRKNNFEYGFASLKGNNRKFYNDLMSLITELNPIISISFSNKFEILLRETIRNLRIGQERENDFFYTLAKFFSLYGHNGFFDKVRKYPEEALFDVAERLKRMIKRDAGIPRLEHRNAAFGDVVRIIEQVTFDITPVDYSNYPFIVLPDALVLLLDEIGMSPFDVDVVIDGEEGLYSCFDGRFRKVTYADSKDEPLIRISDHLAGLISRMCYALRNDPNRCEPEPNASREEKNRLRLLSPKWFDVKEDTFTLYRQAYVALVQNNQHYWTTMTTAFSDDLFYFITLLMYFESIENYEDYLKRTPAEHSRMFENFSVHCTKNIPERPDDPTKILAKYEN